MTNIKRIINKLLYPQIKQRGSNNSIEISDSAFLRKVRIKIYGSNNTITVKNNVYLHNVYIRIGFPDTPINNCKIIIEENTGFNSGDIQLGESNSSLTVGKNCMFSFGIEITCTDTHSIFDMNGNLINKGESIEIGSNAWVCKNAVIMKNSKIPDNCIVAQNCIVTGKFYKENCVLAGIPAKVVKENIYWKNLRPENFLKQESQITKL